MTNKIEDHVVSLEMAKKLKDAGWGKECLFTWVHGFENINLEAVEGDYVWETHEVNRLLKYYSKHEQIYPAPLATELLEQLPEYIELKGTELYSEQFEDAFLEIYKDSSNLKNEEWYLVRYHSSDGIGGKKIQVGFNTPTMCESLVRMWIYLKQQNLL